jgi:hypothetical protein
LNLQKKDPGLAAGAFFISVPSSDAPEHSTNAKITYRANGTSRTANPDSGDFAAALAFGLATVIGGNDSRGVGERAISIAGAQPALRPCTIVYCDAGDRPTAGTPAAASRYP